jgi:RHS repeat-associated protein
VEGGIFAVAIKDLFRFVDGDAAKIATNDLGKSATEGVALRGGRQTARKAAHDGENRALEADARATTKDPIDVASGEVILRQTDVDLDSVLPLVVERTHLSSYRCGRWFGISWASTLDQHLEVTPDGVYFAAADGMVLAYPRATGVDARLLPLEGPRRPLTARADGSYLLENPLTGRTLHFRDVVPGRELPLVAITDHNGNRIDVVHDEHGTPTELRHSGGHRIGVDTERERIVALRLLTGAGGVPAAGEESGGGVTLVRFGYDEPGHLTEVARSSGPPLRFTYDAQGRLTGWTDRNEYRYGYAYDELGRGVRGYGSHEIFNADLAYSERVTVVTDSLGHATTYRLNELGQVVAETDPLGNVTRREWDRHGRMLAETDPLGRTTRYVYDETGNLIRLIRPDGGQIAAEYDALNVPVAVTEADGATWRNTYDERGNLTAVVDPVGAVTRFTYDARGALTSITDPAGGHTVIQTDAAGLPVTKTDPMGATTRYRRDAFGRVREMVDPAGGTTRLSWTVEGHLASRASPSGATDTWTYDGEGNPVEHVNAIGQVTRTEYGPFDAPTARVGPDGVRLEFGYDSELRLNAVTNAKGLRWRYEYDGAGRLTGETDFDGRVLRYVHDAAGRLVRRVNGAGQAIHYDYDVLGNVARAASDGQETTFAYDRAGRLVRAANRDAELSLRRDPLGRIVAEAVNGRVLHSLYDASGRRVRRRAPSGAESVWHYDLAGRPVALEAGGQVVRFGYDAAGREVERRIGAGSVLARAWDADHRLSTQTLWGSPAPPSARQARLLEHRAYAYRPDGNVIGVHDQTVGERGLDLDAAGRVTAVHGADWVERYAYDTVGNLTEASWPSADQDALGPRVYAGTLVRRAGNVHFDYDAQGRVVTRSHRTLSGKQRVWRYAWDAEDRLVGVVTPDGRDWRYRYDPLGRRIAKQLLAPGGSGVLEQTDFTWDGLVLAEQAHRDGTAQRVRATTWDHQPGTFTPLTQIDQTLPPGPPAGPFPAGDTAQEWFDQRFYGIVTDLLGTPTELVDAAGNITWRPRQTLWGIDTAPPAGDVHCPLRFPGQYCDAESRLHYNFHRYYDPTTGHYGAPDPLGLAPAPNPRTYVENPFRWTDPLGLAPYEPQRVYDDSEYNKHRGASRNTSRGVASPAPKDGQAALDRSFDPSPDNPAVFRRYGVDHGNQEIVVLDRHHFITDKDGKITKEIYHGHVPDPSTIPSQITTQLRRQGMIDKKFRVLPPS